MSSLPQFPPVRPGLLMQFIDGSTGRTARCDKMHMSDGTVKLPDSNGMFILEDGESPGIIEHGIRVPEEESEMQRAETTIEEEKKIYIDISYSSGDVIPQDKNTQYLEDLYIEVKVPEISKYFTTRNLKVLHELINHEIHQVIENVTRHVENLSKKDVSS